MSDRSTAVAALLAVLVLLAGCTVSLQTTDYGAEPEESVLSSGGPDEGNAWEVTVTRVVDGDTVEARFPNGEVEELRLLGVDTPETYEEGTSPGEFEGVPDTEAGRQHLLTWGEQASAFARDELAGETVRVAVDPDADRRGGYGRLLVYVYVDGELFNERLLAEGYARLYDTEFTLRDEFASVEAAARNEERGLWGLDGTIWAASTTGLSPRTVHMSSASETPRIAPQSGHS